MDCSTEYDSFRVLWYDYNADADTLEAPSYLHTMQLQRTSRDPSVRALTSTAHPGELVSSHISFKGKSKIPTLAGTYYPGSTEFMARQPEIESSSKLDRITMLMN